MSARPPYLPGTKIVLGSGVTPAGPAVLGATSAAGALRPGTEFGRCLRTASGGQGRSFVHSSHCVGRACGVRRHRGRVDPIEHAKQNAGIVLSAHLGAHPTRTAARQGLVPLQPRVYVARTQPVGAAEQVAAVRLSAQGAYAFLGETALWLYGVGEAPDVVRAGVPHATRYRVRAPAEVRRVAPSVLRGARTIDGCCVVALEVAVIQVSADMATPLPLVERVLRDRRTTTSRLRSRCRRGLAGSAAVRRAVDDLSGTSLDAAVRRLHIALGARGVHDLAPEAHFTSRGGASAYGDLVDEIGLTVVEVDGYLSHIERQRFRADRRRDRWLHRQYGILTLRVDAAETVDDLDALADELAEVILDRRAAVRRPA